jgi:hypothetical protein
MLILEESHLLEWRGYLRPEEPLELNVVPQKEGHASQCQHISVFNNSKYQVQESTMPHLVFQLEEETVKALRTVLGNIFVVGPMICPKKIQDQGLTKLKTYNKSRI